VDRLDGIGDAELRAALTLVRGSPGPVSADQAAAALGVHRSVARARLERLAAAGLLTTSFARRTARSGPGAGRPAKLYSPAPESQALEFPARRLPELVARLLDEIPEEGREQALRRAGEDFGRRLARTVGLRPAARAEDGLERVCGAMRSLGFQARLDRFQFGVAVIDTPTCPLRPLVCARADAAHIDRGVWAGLLERALPGTRAAEVECETRSCLEDGEACSVVIRMRR